MDVQDEFLRLMRAIYDSLERESELQRQLRRTKEALVSVALRLQVAIKLAKDDEQTLAQLTAEAEESKSRELAATKRADEAVTLIRALTIEVNSLKRQLKAYEAEKIDGKSSQASVMSLTQQVAMNDEADSEVDAMLSGPSAFQPVFKDVSEVALKNATPFDKWKMSQLLFTPDTPAASLNHDKHVVDILMESATQELIDDIRQKRTVASIGKMKKLQKRIANEQDRSKMMSMTVHPANDYEGLVLNNPAILPTTADNAPPQLQAANIDESFDEFFLSASAEQKWGNRPTFDNSNLGRVNLWAANDLLHPIKSKSSKSPMKPPARLQSLSQSQTRVGPASNNTKLYI